VKKVFSLSTGALRGINPSRFYSSCSLHYAPRLKNFTHQHNYVVLYWAHFSFFFQFLSGTFALIYTNMISVIPGFRGAAVCKAKVVKINIDVVGTKTPISTIY